MDENKSNLNLALLDNGALHAISRQLQEIAYNTAFNKWLCDVMRRELELRDQGSGQHLAVTLPALDSHDIGMAVLECRMFAEGFAAQAVPLPTGLRVNLANIGFFFGALAEALSAVGAN